MRWCQLLIFALLVLGWETAIANGTRDQPRKMPSPGAYAFTALITYPAMFVVYYYAGAFSEWLK